MPSLQIPGSLCASLHPDYQGAESHKPVLDFIVKAAKGMIVDAVETGLPPARLAKTHDPGITRNISLPLPIMKVIDDYAFRQSLSQTDALRAYLLAAIARGDALKYRKTERQINDGLARYRQALDKDYQRRVEQSVLYEYVLDTLSEGKTGLIEGATGIGKTLSIVAAAAEIIPDIGRVVVAAPTIQILRDFISTHAAIEQSLKTLPAKRVVLGRPEYLSRTALETVLVDGAIADIDPLPVREWLKKGAKPLGQDIALDQDYLVSSLLVVSPTFPVDAVRLMPGTSEDDPGYQSYRRQFEREEDEGTAREIIYCTHAMLGIDLRRMLTSAFRSEITAELRGEIDDRMKKELEKRKKLAAVSGDQTAALQEINRKIAEIINEREAAMSAASTQADLGHLPPWQYLIIDEAHLFESNLANVLASHVSMLEFGRKARLAKQEGTLTAAALKTIEHALVNLRNLAPRSEEGVDLNNLKDPATLIARAALLDIAEAVCRQRGAGSEAPNMVRLRAEARDIKRALEVANKSTVRDSSVLRFSPVREFPQLSFGRRSIDRELSFLWNRANAVACVSATLYVRRIDKYSGSYMASILRLPTTRIKEYPPIRPAWCTEPVMAVWTPAPVKLGDRYWLQPPSRSDKYDAATAAKRQEIWLGEVADEIVHVAETAVGGTLVLMTSYDSVKKTASAIGERIPVLVLASTKSSLSQQRDLFMQYAATGRKPVWLALGGAWTGLDINGSKLGIPACEDDILTDLVIPRVPFALNTTITHAHRMETRAGVPWELLDTSMRFKQGLGRPIRREGLKKNRRFFILDGRMNDERFASYMTVIRQMIEIYPQKKLTPTRS